jgi:hypothetical protein
MEGYGLALDYQIEVVSERFSLTSTGTEMAEDRLITY